MLILMGKHCAFLWGLAKFSGYMPVISPFSLWPSIRLIIFCGKLAFLRKNRERKERLWQSMPMAQL